MAESTRQQKPGDPQSIFPPNLVEVQEHNTALITRANEVMLNTARAVWEREMELFWLESEQLAKTLVPSKLGDDPTKAVSACCEQWHECSEKLLNQMRSINDLVRECGWDLFHIYQESLREAAKPFQPRSR